MRKFGLRFLIDLNITISKHPMCLLSNLIDKSFWKFVISVCFVHRFDFSVDFPKFGICIKIFKVFANSNIKITPMHFLFARFNSFISSKKWRLLRFFYDNLLKEKSMVSFLPPLLYSYIEGFSSYQLQYTRLKHVKIKYLLK